MNSRLQMPRLALAVLLFVPSISFGHFIWIRIEPTGDAKPCEHSVRVFFNEEPHPEAPEFLRFVRAVKPTVDGVALDVHEGKDSIEARWMGRSPLMVDVHSDLGVVARGEKPHRLYYTARAQSAPVSLTHKEAGDKLRVRLVDVEGRMLVQVLFNAEPVAKARIKIYPEQGTPIELAADASGLASVEGLSEGKASLWANWNDGTPGELGGKEFAETRYYATLTVLPGSKTAVDQSTHFATMPDPAVNSFGAAVVGDWLYVYSGHVGRTHHYNSETTSKHFRRLNLHDRTTWEELPMDKDLQGVALVSDGKRLYRTGGMAARNRQGDDHDLHSVADFACFDPTTKIWTALPAMPEPRSTHDSVIIGRTLYVAGGWTMQGASDESVFCKSALAFDLDSPDSGWRVVEQPFERRALAVGECDGKLVVMGGLVGGGMQVERRVDVYDPTTKLWSRGPDLPGSAKNEGFGPSAMNVDGRLYVSGASGTIFQLSEAGDTWLAAGSWVQPRITHRLVGGPDHHLFAVGGNFQGKQTPLIEWVPVKPTIRDETAGR